jgi:hypothetical protein
MYISTTSRITSGEELKGEGRQGSGFTRHNRVKALPAVATDAPFV